MTDADVEAFMANYIHLSINDDDADTSSSATYMPIVATNHSDTILPTLVSPSFVSGPSQDRKPPQRLVHNQHFSSSSATSTSIGSYQSGSSSQPRNNFFTQRNVPIRETPRPLTAIMPPFPFIDSSFVPYRAVGSLMQQSPEGIIVRDDTLYLPTTEAARVAAIEKRMRERQEWIRAAEASRIKELRARQKKERVEEIARQAAAREAGLNRPRPSFTPEHGQAIRQARYLVDMRLRIGPGSTPDEAIVIDD
ncbi:unnamed protein product [Tilletia controversa]|nr:unnamed protein product [Tilletia controversa]